MIRVRRGMLMLIRGQRMKEERKKVNNELMNVYDWDEGWQVRQ